MCTVELVHSIRGFLYVFNEQCLNFLEFCTPIIALQSTTPSHTLAKELFAASSKEISDIQRQLTELETCLTHEWNVVVEAVNSNNMDQAKVAALKHQSYLKRYCSLNTAVVNVYEKEIGKLKETGSEYPISVLQQQQMAKEVKKWNISAHWV